MFGVSPILIRFALEDSGGLGVLGGLVSYAAAAAILAPIALFSGQASGALNLDRGTQVWFLSGGLTIFLGHMFRFLALSLAPVTIVIPLLRSQTIFALGAWVRGEPALRKLPSAHPRRSRSGRRRLVGAGGVMGCVTLVLDLGSSRMRCVSVAGSRPAQAVEVASAPYPTVGARAGGLDRSFNPRLLRRRLFDVLAKGAREVGPGNVETVAVVGQRCAVCFFDAELRTVYAGPQNDIRAVFEGGAIDEEHGPLVHATTGHLPSLMLVPAKLHWWRTQRPRAASRIAKASGLGRVGRAPAHRLASRDPPGAGRAWPARRVGARARDRPARYAGRIRGHPALSAAAGRGSGPSDPRRR